MQKPLIGFIGQGWIGRNYADDFEKRGFGVVRYALEKEYNGNRDRIKDCDIVFIAVPTPTTPAGFDSSIIENALKLVGPGKIAVVKSTILPGTTERIQADNPDIFVMHSPEFLREANAAYDAAHPERNIIGIPIDSDEYRQQAKYVLSVLPEALYYQVCGAKEAELIKYGGNIFLYFKVMFANLMYDLCEKLGTDWEEVAKAIAADRRIGPSHLNVIHDAGTGPGRGAGGHCFIKDFEAFIEMYERSVGDEAGDNLLKALRNKNIKLLQDSGKDLDLLEGVYGKQN